MQFKLITVVSFLFIGYVHADDCPVVKGSVDVCTKEKCEKIEKTVIDLSGSITSIKNKAATTTSNNAKEISKIKTDYENDISTLKKEYSELKEKISAIESKKEPEVVAFSAFLKTPIKKASAHQTVKFDKVQTNKGNCYDPTTGIFTAKDEGLYIFQWTVLTDDGNVGDTFMVLNGKLIVRNAADSKTTGHYGYRSGSQSIILSLKRNDRVWIRTKKTFAIVGATWSSFHGWLHR